MLVSKRSATYNAGSVQEDGARFRLREMELADNAAP